MLVVGSLSGLNSMEDLMVNISHVTTYAIYLCPTYKYKYIQTNILDTNVVVSSKSNTSPFWRTLGKLSKNKRKPSICFRVTLYNNLVFVLVLQTFIQFKQMAISNWRIYLSQKICVYINNQDIE